MFEIRDGIVIFLIKHKLDHHSSHEAELRDHQAHSYDKDFDPSTVQEKKEMIPTLSALEPLKDKTVLELGCGTGRYTLPILEKCRNLVAVDFSLESLRILARKLSSNRSVGLICADISNFKCLESSFDMVFSTLTSNLPSYEHRRVMYLLAKRAMNRGGSFVLSAHYYNFRLRLTGIKQSGYYRQSGIYRYIFKERELRKEIREFFRLHTIQLIQVVLPGKFKIGLHNSLIFSLIISYIPIFNIFASLILIKARH